MTGNLIRRLAIVSSIVLLILGAPLSASANDMCMVIPVLSFPFFLAGSILATIVYLIARRTAGTRAALTIILTVGTVLTGIPALVGTGFAVAAACSCSHHIGAVWLFLLLFALYVAGITLAGRTVARRKPKSCLPSEGGTPISPTHPPALAGPITMASDQKPASADKPPSLPGQPPFIKRQRKNGVKPSSNE